MRLSPTVVESLTSGKRHRVDSEAEHPDASGRYSRPGAPPSWRWLARSQDKPAHQGTLGGLLDTIVSNDTFVQ